MNPVKKKFTRTYLLIISVGLFIIFLFFVFGNILKTIDPHQSQSSLPYEEYYYQEEYKRIPRIIPSDFNRKSSFMLSDLISDFHVVKLDSHDPEAMLGQYVGGTLSEHFIGIKNSEPSSPFRLFDRETGKFIRKIGNIGKGPGEYPGLYDWVIDEKNNRIYLVPFARANILEYSLSGNYIGTINIPGKKGYNKKMKIEVQDSIFTAYILPFPEDSIIIYTFSKDGRILTTTPNPFGGEHIFDNEIYINKNRSISGYLSSNCPIYFQYDHRVDSLRAVFGIDKSDIKEEWWSIVYETPIYSLIKVFFLPYDNQTKRPKDYWLVLNKHTNEKFAANLINDYLGGIETDNSSYPNKYYKDHNFIIENGYYVEIIPAVILKRLLKEVLERKNLEEEMRNKIAFLYSSFDEDDNHFLFYGKLKLFENKKQ